GARTTHISLSLSLSLLLTNTVTRKMEDQCSTLSWGYYYQEEGFEELKHALLYTTLELQTTIHCTHEELATKADELVYLRGVLTRTIKERDEAHSKCQSLILDTLLLQRQLCQQAEAVSLIGTTRNEDEPTFLGGDSKSNHGFSSSGCDENVTVSPGTEQIPPSPIGPVPLPPSLSPSETDVIEELASKKALPQKGKFLQALMEAGPLLQTLLLAGPLPQWQYPPPQLNSIDIPPVSISSPAPRTDCFGKKRGLLKCEGSDSSSNTKNQK
ncbi:hypothetical protein RJ640_022700, partial [Escallonia rubra]